MEEMQQFNKFGFIVSIGKDNKTLHAIKADRIDYFENFLYEDSEGEIYQGCRFYVGGNAIESKIPLNDVLSQLSDIDPSLR